MTGRPPMGIGIPPKNPYKVEVFLPATGSSWIRVYANGKVVYAGGRIPTGVVGTNDSSPNQEKAESECSP